MAFEEYSVLLPLDGGRGFVVAALSHTDLRESHGQRASVQHHSNGRGVGSVHGAYLLGKILALQEGSEGVPREARVPNRRWHRGF